MPRSMLLAAVLLVAVTALVSWSRPKAGELPVHGDAPSFRLTDQNGEAFDSAELEDHIWIVDFIFTNCPGICPMMTAQMARVQTALESAGDAGTRIVSITVDPKNDTPAVLKEYAERFGVEGTRWKLLTGSRDALYDLISEGFNLSVAERTDDPDGQGLITHSDRFVLIDGDGRVRGYYSGTETASVDQLIADLAKLR